MSETIERTWALTGPDQDFAQLPPDRHYEVMFENDEHSEFSVSYYINEDQIGSLGPGTKSDVYAVGPDEIAKVISHSSVSGTASGKFHWLYTP
jgi:hypothetical protein